VPALTTDPEATAREIYARRRPVNDPDAARHLLSPDEGRRIFREQIIPDLLSGPEPQEDPTVVFLVGQHGAGKSRIASMLADVLNKQGGFADLDSDLYKPYHPWYDELMRRDDTLTAAYIGPDSWAWLAQAHEYARAEKINVLKPETGQDSQGAAAHMRAYRDAGFSIEVMVIAVPAAMSNQGILNRYYEQVIDRGHGRLTVQANADRAYTGILDLADVIDGERLADGVGVFRRGEAVPRYGNALDAAGEWQDPPSLRAAIESERAREWTAEETADFLRTDTKLRNGLGDRWAERLDEILVQAEPLMNQAQRARDRSVADPRPEGSTEARPISEMQRALEVARDAAGAIQAQEALQRQRTIAEAQDADRHQAAHWRAATDQQHERDQISRTNEEAVPDREPEAGR
jgi:energy-coupling factor transporter ATP-binding protein EcfA2